MPWGCIGSSKLGDGLSGPGKPNCGLPGTFNLVSNTQPGQGMTQFVNPQLIQTQR